MIDTQEPQPQPQTVTNVQLASFVAKDVELESILLTTANLESHVTREMDVTKLALAQQFRPGYELLDGPRRLRVRLAFILDLSSPTDPPTNVLHLAAEYALMYRLPEGGAPYPSEALEAFADLNGALNVWPYWRELVHTVVARAGLGSITLPVFRVQPRPVEQRPPAVPTPKASTG